MWLSRYIFFADKVEIQDITKQTCFFVLLGPKSSQVRCYRVCFSLISCFHRLILDSSFKQIMEDLNLGDLVGQAHGSHKHYSVSSINVLCRLIMFDINFCILVDARKHQFSLQCARFSLKKIVSCANQLSLCICIVG